MRKPKAYVASYLGFTETGRLFYRIKLIPLLERIGIEVIDPWSLTPLKLLEEARSLPTYELRKERFKTINAIFGANNARGEDEADIIVAVLDGPDVDSGTASEVGYGAAKGKVIFGYRNDFRRSGENEASIINLQLEYFINNSGGAILTSLQELDETLTKYVEDFNSK